MSNCVWTGKGKGKLRHNPERRAEYETYALAKEKERWALEVPESEVPPLNREKLELGASDLEDRQAVQIFKQLASNEELRELDVSGNWLTDTAALVLAEVLPDTQIRRIDLSSNCIGILGMQAIFAVMPESKVKHIVVSSNGCDFSPEIRVQLMSILPNNGAAFDVRFEDRPLF